MGDEQGDVQVGLVEEDAVAFLAVLAEGFTVVADDDQQRFVFHSRTGQPFIKAFDLRIHEGDFAVICRREFRWWAVRAVGVEKMDPAEERVFLVGVQPCDGAVGDDVGRTFPMQRLGFDGDVGHFVVVHVEAAVEPETRVKHEAGHKSGGPVALLLEDGGECEVCGAEGGLIVDSDSEFSRLATCHHRAVRWQSQWYLGECVFEKRAASGNRIEGGGPGGLVAVATDAVSSCGIQRDEKDVMTGDCRWLCGIAFATTGSCYDGDKQDQWKKRFA